MCAEAERMAAAGSGAVAKPGSRSRAFRFKCVVAAVAMLGGLLAAEIGMRLFVPVTGVAFCFWDPVVGVRRAPNQQGQFMIGDYVRAPFHFNAQGWNYPEDYQTVKPSGALRVCVVGDSYVEALHVPHEQALFAVAEERMDRADRRVQWYAFGNSGYGTTQHYLLIQHYVLDYHPDVVILLFNANDPADCSPYLNRLAPYSARYVLDEDDQLKLLPAEQWKPSRLRRLVANSALVRYLSAQRRLFERGATTVARVSKNLGEGVRFDVEGAPQAANLSAEERQQKTWKLIEVTLARAKSECAAHGALFAVAFRGSRPAIRAAENKTTYQPPPKDTDPYCMGDRLHEMGKEFVGPICQRLGIPYLDLMPSIVEKVKETGQRHDFPDDGHYGPIGHAAAGEALAEWVEVLLQDSNGVVEGDGGSGR